MQLLTRFAWAFGLAGLLAVISGSSLWWLFGSVEGRPSQFLMAGAVLLFAYAFLDRENVGDTVQTRGFQFGTSSAILVALMATACVATYALSKRHDKTWDLTRDKSFTLSDHSKKVLSGLDEPVEVLAFFRSDATEQREFRRLFDRFDEHTDHLSVQWIDPVRQPRLAAEHEVASDAGGVMLKTADDRVQRMETDWQEESFITKLVLLTSRTEHRICWAMGHGEPDPDDEFSERGLGGIVLLLEAMNYQVTREVVPTVGVDPACDAVVIAAPQTDWLAWEREGLAAYLGAGGRVLYLSEPGGPPEIAAEMARYGVALRSDVVLDVNVENQMMGVDDPSVVVLHGRNLLSHTITRNLSGAVVMLVARSVSADAQAPGVTAQTVIQASLDSWGELDLSGEDLPEPDYNTELVGEVPVMAVSVVEDPAALQVLPHDEDEGRAVPEDWQGKAGGRLVVIGDMDFASNLHVIAGNNRDLFLNSLAWLVEEEDQIGERPEAGQTLEITELENGALCLITGLFLPGGAAALGMLVLFRRRRL